MLPPEVAGGDFHDNNRRNAFSRMEPTTSNPITPFLCFFDGADDIGRSNCAGATVQEQWCRSNGATMSDNTTRCGNGMDGWNSEIMRIQEVNEQFGVRFVETKVWREGNWSKYKRL